MALGKFNGVSLSSITKFNGISKGSISKIGGINVPSSQPTLLLDTYTGAAAAYSFRELNSSYSGNCVRVQNNSGVNLDVGFSNGYVDTSAISTHCGTGDGKIVTWYDQSGNGRNITQSSTSAMPKLFIGGTLNNVNSKLAANFDGNDRLVTGQVSLHSGAWYCTSALKMGSSVTAANMQIWNQDDSFYGPRIAQYLRTHTNAKVRSVMFNTSRNNFANTTSTSIAANTQYQISAYTDTSATEVKAFVNSTNTNSATSYTGTAQTGTHEVAMGSSVHGNTPGNFFRGDIQELIMWPNAQSSNRSTIETNLDTYYSIP